MTLEIYIKELESLKGNAVMPTPYELYKESCNYEDPEAYIKLLLAAGWLIKKKGKK